MKHLMTFPSEANKLYNLRAICKHFVHVLQLLTWQGNISDPTLSLKRGVQTRNTLPLSPCTFSRCPHSERTDLRSFQLHSSPYAREQKVPAGLSPVVLPAASAKRLLFLSWSICVLSFRKHSEGIEKPCSNSSYTLGRRKQKNAPILN